MIIDADEVKSIYISNQYVDMRKSLNGLILIVDQCFQMNVLDRSLFIFTNKARTQVKILFYENSGFWLLMKKLEHGKFKIVEDEASKVKTINARQLNWLLEGFEIREEIDKKSEIRRLVI